MALRFEGKHHRNPSSLHAKVNWFIKAYRTRLVLTKEAIEQLLRTF